MKPVISILKDSVSLNEKKISTQTVKKELTIDITHDPP
jgi:hypothetical protein